MTEDEWEEIEEQLDAERPEAWIPEEPGDTLKGTVKGFGEGVTRFGPQTIVFIDDGEKSWSLWLNATVLRHQFARLQPEIGERIGVRFLGEREGEHQTYKDWKVVVAGRLGTKPNWDQEKVSDEDAEAEATEFEEPKPKLAKKETKVPGPNVKKAKPTAPSPNDTMERMRTMPATEMQLKTIFELETGLGREPGDYSEAGVTRGEAEDYITALRSESAQADG